MADFTIPQAGGLITVKAASSPTPPVITIEDDGALDLSTTGDVTTLLRCIVGANKTDTKKTGTLKITTTTTANTSYRGTVSQTQEKTYEQEMLNNYVKVTGWPPITDKFRSAGTLSSYTLTVSANVDWEITSPDWITITPSTGTGNNSGVKMSVSANSSLTGSPMTGGLRSGTIVVTSSTECRIDPTGMTYQQLGEPKIGDIGVWTDSSEQISISPTTWSPDSAATSMTMTVNSTNAGWTASTSDSWVTLATTGAGAGVSSVLISVSTNTATTQRTGTVTFTTTGGGASATLKITQKEGAITTYHYIIKNNLSSTATITLKNGAYTIAAGGEKDITYVASAMTTVNPTIETEETISKNAIVSDENGASWPFIHNVDYEYLYSGSMTMEGCTDPTTPSNFYTISKR